MRYGDIAAVMDAPINTVKTLIHRARATLARECEDSAEE
jgi:DNA-directed RNA polymerase specialized sigma24 family protein